MVSKFQRRCETQLANARPPTLRILVALINQLKSIDKSAKQKLHNPCTYTGWNRDTAYGSNLITKIYLTTFQLDQYTGIRDSPVSAVPGNCGFSRKTFKNNFNVFSFFLKHFPNNFPKRNANSF